VLWEMLLYGLFYDGEVPPKVGNLPKDNVANDSVWGSSGKDARFLSNFRRFLGHVQKTDRKLLLASLRDWRPRRNRRKIYRGLNERSVPQQADTMRHAFGCLRTELEEGMRRPCC